MGQNGDFAFLPIPCNTKNIIQNGQILMDFRKIFQKKSISQKPYKNDTPKVYTPLRHIKGEICI